jgi:hypothetical protein
LDRDDGDLAAFKPGTTALVLQETTHWRNPELWAGMPIPERYPSNARIQ